MIRRLLASVFALSVVACGNQPNETERAASVDFAVGDECFYTMPHRPEDCADHPACMWSDANLRIALVNGAYQLDASSGAWDGGPPPPSQGRFDATASSPDGLARELPRVLQRFDGVSVTRACVYINPDQSMRLGDVMAFHDALVAQGVRKVGVYAVLADQEGRP
jgi:hypothetical protein